MLETLGLAFVVFLGTVAGAFIGKYTPEEQTLARPYLLFLQKFLLVVFVLFVLVLLSSSYVLFGLGIILGYLLAFVLEDAFYLGILFVLTFVSFERYLLFVSVLEFIYGFPYGVFQPSQLKKLLYLGGLFFLPFLLYFVPGTLAISFFLGVVAGGFMKRLLMRKEK